MSQSLTTQDLLLLIGQKEVELAVLRHQVAQLTEQLKAALSPTKPVE